MAFNTTPVYLGPVATNDSDLEILNAAYLQYAAKASLPAAANAGILGWATDTHDFQYDDGTNLVVLGNPRAFKDTDESTNTDIVLSDDAELSMAVKVSTRYIFRAVIRFNAHATPDLKIALTLPSGTAVELDIMTWTPALNSLVDTIGDWTGASQFLSGMGTEQIMTIEGYMLTSSTAGNVVFQWAQNVSNGSNVTIKRGSYMEAIPCV